MYSRITTVKNPSGLHARPAAEVVATAKKFKSSVKIRTITDENKTPVNAKSIIMLLSLGACEGSQVEILSEGEDEKEAVDAMIALIDGGFGE
jgi:phosphocarrier protein